MLIKETEDLNVMLKVNDKKMCVDGSVKVEMLKNENQELNALLMSKERDKQNLS